MKRYVVWIVSLFILAGCDHSSKELDAGMQLRSSILQSSGCTFTTEITADYGDRICQFTVINQMNDDGNLSFTLENPTTIAGISGRMTGEGGQIIFDEQALYFPLMADELLSPISAPWIMIKALRSGYLTSACIENGETRLSVDDTYGDDDLRLDIWLNNENNPTHVDILHDGRRILTMNVRKFEIS